MAKNKEIERKFLITQLPPLADAAFHLIEQAYLCTEPVVRIRKEDDHYYMTYKALGFLEREEYNLPLTAESYDHLLAKADGSIIRKKRYLLPYLSYTIELDVFEGDLAGLLLAEVEFADTDKAAAFIPPDWFGRDVTYEECYHNNHLSQMKTLPTDKNDM